MAKKQDPQRGGAREGAGRRSLYGERLERIICVELDEPQSLAITKWARRHDVNVAYLMREASLIAAKVPGLGIGFDSKERILSVSAGWAEPRESSKWPLKFTERQHAAVTKVADRLKISHRKFVLEATLAHIGASHLGERGHIDDRSKTLDKIGGGR
jgi:hypothetical protein